MQPLPYLKETPSQTAGPYVHIGLAPRAAGFSVYDHELGTTIAGPKARGTRIQIAGQVLDGANVPVRDVLIEVWQADHTGRYASGDADDGFRGWGRVVPDLATGAFAFETIKPGRVVGHDGRLQAPHLSLWLVARGINVGLQTRMYFPDEDNGDDPLLRRIEAGARRATLVAAAEGPNRYRFDLRLQGDGETVFLDV